MSRVSVSTHSQTVPDAAQSRVDYLVIGHVTHDILSDGRRVLGGTASYAALTAAAMGRMVGMVTSTGADADFSTFNGHISVARHLAADTTTFENVYVNGHREQFVYSFATPLTVATIPPFWHATPVVHIGPILHECDPALADYFSGKTFVGITPQGWMRASDAQGRIYPQAWKSAEYLLPLASAIVLSVDDIGGNWDLAVRFAQQTKVLVVTCGWDGGTLFLDGEPMTFPAVPVTEVDPTGAGDIFAAAFFIAMASGVQPLAATRFAACLAAHSVTRIGLASAPQPSEVAGCSLDHSEA
jgi:sugar/nucleoside kinase (ribokinase family)